MATPPVGIVRRVQQDRPRLRVGREELPDVLGRRTKLVLDPQRRQHRPRSPALEVGNVRRKLRAEDQHPVARVEHRLGEILLERLGTRGDDDVLGRRPSSRTRAETNRAAAARKLGQTQARAVARLVILDRLDARLLGVRRGGKRAVADLQLDDVLPLGLEAPRDGQHA